MKKLKKSIIVSVMVATVLSMSMLAVPMQADAAASAGDLIKMDGLSSVYYLAADGKRYVFPNEQTYFSWYSDFSSVVTIPQSELESYSLGANVTIRQGTKLVKITTDPKVYAVESNGSLLHVPDEATAVALYGDNWAQRVVDVPDAFFTNYTVSTETVSATAYPEGSLIKTADVSDVYYIGADGNARKVASEAAFTGNRFNWDNVITTTLDIPAAGTEIAAADSALIDTSAGAGGTAGAGTGLTVALASDTPASATLPAGASGVDFTKINFTAANDGDVTVKNIVVTRIGIGEADDFAGVWIYDADGNRLTSARTVSASTNTATFSGVNYAVAAGTTKVLIVRASIDATNGTSGTNGFSINSASNITTDGAAVSGSFPVSGNLMSLSSVTAGVLTYTLNAVENTSLKVGETQKEVADIKLNETSSNEDIYLHSITFTNDGSADANDMKNFKFYQGSNLIAELVSTDTDRVKLVLDTPLEIKKGSSKNFSLKADIMGGVGAGSIIYDIDDATDIVAVGENYGFGVGVAASGGGTSSITVLAGELTIEIDGPAAYDVVADQDDVVLANMTFTTGGDEAVEVKNMYGYIDCTDSGVGAVLQTGMENVQLVNVDSGDYYDVTNNDVGTGSGDTDDYYFKVTNFTIPAGASSWRVEMDLNSTYFGNADVCKFVMYAGDNTAETLTAETTSDYMGVEAENAAGKALNDIKPGSTIEGNNVTVATASLAISNVTLSNGDAVSRTKDVELLRFSAEAGSAEAVKITQVALQATSSAQYLADASNYTLLDSSGTVLQSGVSSVATTNDTVTFSSLTGGGYAISAGETKIFYVTADINSTVTGSQITVRLVDAGITAEDSDGDTLAPAAVTGDVVAVKGRDVTLHSKGTIEFTVDNSSPSNAHILLSSAVDQSIFKFKADASYEDITLKDLRFSVTGTGANATSSIASVELWQDGTLVKEVSAKTDAYGWVFSNLENIGDEGVTVAKDTDSIFELVLNVAGIGDGSQDTASSGADIILTLLPTTTGVQARGYSSNNDLGVGDITITSVATQQQYVYASKVTATKSTSQPATLSTKTLQEVLKFTLTPSSNDSKNALFTDLDIDIGFTGGAATTTHIAYVYSGSTLLATSTMVSSSATNADAGTTNPFLSNGAVWSDEISGAGETYTVKLDLTTDGADDQVTTSININGGNGNDMITWKDGSTGAGSVSWIDLVEGSDITMIENTISN